MYFTAQSDVYVSNYFFSAAKNPTKIFHIHPHIITGRYRIPQKGRNSAETDKFSGSAQKSKVKQL